MKNRLVCSFILVIFLFVGGCTKKETEKTTNQFSHETIQRIKKTAKSYSENELQSGQVPLHTYLQLTGKIIKSDSKTATIKREDRFIFESDQNHYQVFNEQSMKLKIGDTITVYGEYYGFLKAIFVERVKK
ncbi:hypothetical protein [Melissococcus plutonius]|uniref:Lipoprotein n=1 Tax=Melissococcus plutonius (strain ATCC 35311 / DSM 29964 / CIP 104052 / LMG 20360 / NCIMB 702443) TaxID=940190 RepID=F3Y8Q6_MELPT|nr:hypothetical protein [Melissococcus plutonius]AIM24548.1 putative lipoprotein [Melissococcus plutonius S1]KMT24615.1 putative lipoprotein [Melissococcus plutonius]KMT27328.1 putative lipoprotein [Melissococcus plutonius]KMT27501.1 putative lipoprotein [Melissococcus plutonius]KMT29275.1 putative lipoprotein [Melissococcus plutonius]